MRRSLNFTAPRCLLMAACAVLTLTAGAQAQVLTNDMKDAPGDFDLSITLDNTGTSDPNPMGDVGTSGTLTQLNLNTGHNFSYGGVPFGTTRTYEFTEVNINGVNLNPDPASGENPFAVYNNCEINLCVPVAPAFPDFQTGFIGNNATLDENTTLNMTGGLLGNLADVSGTINISGGRIGSFADIDGTLNLSGTGGTGSNSTILSGGEVNISAPGAFVFFLNFNSGSTVTMTAGQIQNLSTIAGVGTISGGQIGSFVNIDGNVTMSGTATTLTTSRVRSGGVLTVTSDDNIVNGNWTFEAGSTVNMEAGSLRSWSFDNGMAGELNISGGGSGASNESSGPIVSGGVLNLSGGVLGTNALIIRDGAVVNQTGGDLGFNTDVEDGGVLNISGGTFGTPIFNAADLDVESGGTVNFCGTEFFIDGAPIPGLMPGTTVTIAAADRGLLTGTLEDGSPVGATLGSGILITPGGGDDFDAGSIVTVTLKATIIKGDVSGDGLVTFGDVGPLLDMILGVVPSVPEADVNCDTLVNFADVGPLLAIILGL